MIDPRRRQGVWEAIVVGVLFIASCALSYEAMRAYRAAGIQPSFYQSNFEPAVLMACGLGFGVSPAPPPELVEFLQTRRSSLDCAVLPKLPSGRLTVTANANWYYMYGTAAAIWRVTGVSWTALDGLVAVFGGSVTLLLYGLFRFVAGRSVAAAFSMFLTASPANLVHLLSLRDYSKAPFVLAAVLILAVLVVRPMSRARTLLLAGLCGVVVGIGYGFRSDLVVMVPFGAIVVLLLLPGSLKVNIVRNGTAAVVLVAAFLISAAPVIAGLKLGGCQYHFALLGLTEPLTTELRLTPPLYRFGTPFLDVFVNMKVGDYAWRVLQQPITDWCDGPYDTASGQLYIALAKTFPADFVVRAYASVLMILRVGLGIPRAMVPDLPFPSAASIRLYETLNTLTWGLTPLGPVVTLAAIALAWAASARLGVALTVFILFLAGYPGIRFDERHWFHLRFIPWWAAAMVVGQIRTRGLRGWDRPALVRAAAGVVGLLVTMSVTLAGLRAVQGRSVRTLIARYLAAPTEDLPIVRKAGSIVQARWQPRDYGRPPLHQGADFIVATLDAAHCTGTGPVTLRATYDVDSRDGGHDLSTSFVLQRPAIGAEPTRVFVPVFWAGVPDRTFLRFSGFEVSGASSACVGRVARVVDGASEPLWLEMQLPPDWSTHRLYQTIAPPRFLQPFFKSPL